MIPEIVVLGPGHKRCVDFQERLSDRIAFLDDFHIHLRNPLSGSVKRRRESLVVLQKVGTRAGGLIGGFADTGLVSGEQEGKGRRVMRPVPMIRQSLAKVVCSANVQWHAVFREQVDTRLPGEGLGERCALERACVHERVVPALDLIHDLSELVLHL